jgi:hypothetical protein
MSDWVLYTRDSCSLCEAFIQDLIELMGEQRASTVRLIDIGSSAELEARYGLKIPVLTIDGDMVCKYRLDADRVRAHLV